MPEALKPYIEYFSNPYVRAGVILGAAFLAAIILRFVAVAAVSRFTQKTKTEWDNRIVSAVKAPVFYSIVLLGLSMGFKQLELSETLAFAISATIKTIIILLWAVAAGRIVAVFLQIVSHLTDRFEFIKPSTLPLFQIMAKLVVFGGAAYLFFVSWHIDVTGWLASAGIVGIAVGFAAKDTLANLFAGIFILTDAPYKLGDFILLSDGQRGQVTNIGIRSTRLLTREDIEITIPNAVIGNSQIINETSGPHEKRRVSIMASVAYGSDVDQVREVLMKSIENIAYVCDDPAPTIRFKQMADSGLNFEIRVWIDEPVHKGRVVDALNTNAYKALNAAGIEIPYPKQDVYVKQMPGGDGNN